MTEVASFFVRFCPYMRFLLTTGSLQKDRYFWKWNAYWSILVL